MTAESPQHEASYGTGLRVGSRLSRLPRPLKGVLSSAASVAGAASLALRLLSYGASSAVALGVLMIIGAAFLSAFDATHRQRDFISQSEITPKQFFATYCAQKRICRQFAASRQECATAGNIAACIAIKLNGADYRGCTTTGELDIGADVTPSALQCLVH